MSARALLGAALALGCWLSFGEVAVAQQRDCVVEQAPPLNFGRPGSNPTATVVTSSSVTVRCTGNGSEGGARVRVCIRLDPTPGQTTQRYMASGAALLAYQIHATSANGPVVALEQTADGEMTLDQGSTSHPYGTVTIPLYGVIASGQTGLSAGTYTEAIRGEVHSTATPETGCTTKVQATLNTSASAILPGSCSIVADDLAFGSHSTLAGGVSAAGGIRLTCTTNTAYSVGIDGGGSGDPANRLMRRDGTGPETIGYGLFRDAGRTQPWGNTAANAARGVGTGFEIPLTAYGHVPAQPQPLSGDYRDTVVVTIEY